jgi:hypothetical protein
MRARSAAGERAAESPKVKASVITASDVDDLIR